MLGDLWTFLQNIFLNWLGLVGLFFTGLRIWAEFSENPARNFLGNRHLLTRLAVGFLFAACFQAWRAQHAELTGLRRTAGPRHAVVSADGTILAQRNFAEYGLTVEVKEERGSDGESWSAYHLRFAREPEHFEIRTDDGATPARNRVARRVPGGLRRRGLR